MNALLFTLFAFLGMEVIAWVTHKYLMHGPMWNWHESHHQPRKGVFEKNDLFGLVFSTVAIILIGCGLSVWPPALWLGLGMTLYGGAYLFLHDMLAHKRFGVHLHPRSGYLRQVLRSHRVHHAHHQKIGCVSFGFLIPKPGLNRAIAKNKTLIKNRAQGLANQK